MIDSLRRKMIFLSAVSVTIVLSLIFLAIYTIGMRQLNTTMDMLTDAISENDGWFPPFKISWARCFACSVVIEEIDSIFSRMNW